MLRMPLFLCVVALALLEQRPAVAIQVQTDPESVTSLSEVIAQGIDQLLKIQNDDGAWPYEGVYRVKRKIPVGYRIGGTAICCQALMYGAPAENQATKQAIADGVDLILKELDHPLMTPSELDRYDVRVWGHIYALDLFCRIQQSDRFSNLKQQTAPWIPKLTKILLQEELETGGWNYANRRSHAAFVTAPAVQSLLWARQCGENIPDNVWTRSVESLLRSRNDDAAFAYSGDENSARPTKLPGSIARSANGEATLSLLGLERTHAIETALAAFHEHWGELEKRRKKNGTHKPPFGVAPYYFYYGHRYAATAIQRLEKSRQVAEFQRLNKVIMRTRDSDGTWNDRVFDRSRAYGTAMAVLALSADQVPQPESLPRGSTFTRPELISPRIEIELSADRVVTIGESTVPVGELASWLANRPDLPHPNCILIQADGSTKTRDVETVKQTLLARFGKTSVFVGVSESK